MSPFLGDGSIDPLSVLFTIFPFPLIFLPIRPGKHPKAFLFIIRVGALIYPIIRPGESTMPVHLIRDPGTDKSTAIRPVVYPGAFDVIILKLPNKMAPVCPLKLPTPILHPVEVLTFINSTIRPAFDPIPMLDVIDPLAFILSAIAMCVHAISIGLPLGPLAYVKIATLMYKPTYAMGEVVGPVPLMYRPIGPELFPFSMLQAILSPASYINNPILPLNRPSDETFYLIRFGIRVLICAKSLEQLTGDFSRVIWYNLPLQEPSWCFRV
jgi:hypothetical protein